MKQSIIFTLFMIILGASALTPVQAEDLVYVAVEPCRIVDTRNAGGAIPANNFRNFQVSGTVGELAVQGGNSDCLDPEAGTGQKPLAIVAYVLAVPPPGSGSGVLTAYPSNQPPPPVGSGSTVNFAAGQIIGNTTTITLCDPSGFCPTDGEFSILARNTNQHVVIDIQGYFYPTPSRLSTVKVFSSSDRNLSFNVASETILATCPPKSIVTGGGVDCLSLNFDSSTTNYGVVITSNPVGNGYVGTCGADGLFYDNNKFGPPITVFALCAFFDDNVTPLATSESVAAIQASSLDTETDSQPQQGDPSQEALLILESLRESAAERERMINER